MLTAKRIRKKLRKEASRGRLRVLTAVGKTATRNCPACKQDIVGFFRYGEAREWGCPACGASPRERLMHALLDVGVLGVPEDAAVLHCAPGERRLVDRFRASAVEFVPGDIDPTLYDVDGIQKIDLMTLAYNEHFDRIYASHVMEHVPDDALVLENIRRALKPGGEAWLLVPLWEKSSEDGPPDLDPRERERRYGQWDHVRQYGLDFADRIEKAGLSVDIIDGYGAFEPEDIWRMGLDDRVFRAQKL